MITLQIHIANSEPIKVDVEEMPSMSDIAIIGANPRDRQERELSWVDDGVNTIVIPWSRINFIQVLPDQEAIDEFPLPFRND
ncbi:MAG: hypothetical protein CL610_09520 [Anaerolineaceae bacterium]|nr:hypothetical protein [Anaerolineaceae bacterium]